MCAFFICVLYLSKNIKNYSLKPSYVLPHLVVYRSFPGKFLIMFARKKKNGQSKGELCTVSLTHVALVPGWCFASGPARAALRAVDEGVLSEGPLGPGGRQ